MSPWAIWLIVGLALLIAELFTLTFFLLWLAVGCLVGALAAWLAPDSLWLQAVAAIVAAGGLTAFAQPLVRKWRATPSRYKDSVDRLVGRNGIAEEDVSVGSSGLVRIDGQVWSAYSQEPLAKGDRVVVVQRGTTRLEVRKGGEDG
ncbi:NfeD family protein [Cohnella zeiphila]|uniref:NfeD family protein n=1 Tax=Cohnella zeiphila TaxID=2761120 RepID=A0A7X0SJ80_9BACL|nr:NfeD family protein [Cohnella zeiphila]